MIETISYYRQNKNENNKQKENKVSLKKCSSIGNPSISEWFGDSLNFSTETNLG